MKKFNLEKNGIEIFNINLEIKKIVSKNIPKISPKVNIILQPFLVNLHNFLNISSSSLKPYNAFSIITKS